MQFSVIVPVYEQWHLIPALIERLGRQSIAADFFEVKLVDNGSENFCPPADLPPHIAVTRCTKPGSYAARNRGASQASGSLLVFTDADCLPRPDWLERMGENFGTARAEPIVAAGRIEMVAETNQINAFQTYDLVRGIPQRRYVKSGGATTANLAMEAVLFRRLGGFDETLFSGGDAELCRRARSAGAVLVYTPGAVVEHRARATWKALKYKTQRLKAGQLATSAGLRHAEVWLRTFMPPVGTIRRLWAVREQPWRRRIIAIAVHQRIWMVEMRETLCLLWGKYPERR